MESLTIRPCSIDDLEFAPNIGELLAEYAQESAIRGLVPASAQFEQYRQLVDAGVMRVIGAFHGETLVGVIALIASVIPHFGCLVASTESFFVAAAARKTGAGLRLLREAERVAGEMGAVGLFVSAPLGGQLADVLDAHSAYAETNRVFFRGLA
ncbi:MAG: GNAT family N-acetyltransferase [Pseudomonadaceae bacterium]